MANFTYLDSAITGTAQAQVIDSLSGSDDDRVVYKIMVGKPTAAGVITVWSINNALANNTGQIAFKYTYPTFANGTPASDNFSFTTGNDANPRRDGLVLSGGGSFATSVAMQVTVLWDNPDS